MTALNISQWWGSRPAAWRLTIAYMGILVGISMLFSVALYQLSAHELAQSLSQQYVRLRSPLGQSILVPPNQDFIEQELAAGKRRLALQLLYFNIIIVAGGSAASYFLARRTLRPIEDALTAQTRFAADASHELRTPLAAMQAEIEVALRNGKLSAAEARELLQSNLEEVGKLKALAEGLLRLARADGQAVPLSPVDLALVMTEAVRRVSGAAQAKSITVETDVTDLAVLADSPSLVELFVILLDNAVKYSPEKTTVAVGVHPRGRWAEITIRDQGRGIKPSDLPHIFERFYRADASRSKNHIEGYGLGLSIAENIAALHRGAISVESEVGQGSVFTLRLPLVS